MITTMYGCIPIVYGPREPEQIPLLGSEWYDKPFITNPPQRVATGIFSECVKHANCQEPYCKGRLYRYLLRWPTGLNNDKIALACLANPSEATPDHLDPTLTRWLNWCRDWGFGWSWTVNARAWRATHPKTVPADPLAIGSENDAIIRFAAIQSELVVCGWGKLGGARGPECLKIIREVGKVPHALKLNRDGSPCHPLYLPSSSKPFPMEESL